MSQHSQENDLSFLEEMKDVRPIKQDQSVREQLRKSKGQATLAQQLKREAIESEQNSSGNFLSVEKVTPVDPYDVLDYKKDGVQQGVYKKLRLGQYQIDSRLSLQQHKFEQARTAIFDTIKESYAKGVRTLLIQHGIGKNSKPFPAFMKSYVNQWLKQFPEVLAFHSALRCHGGLAAVYVLLKKNQQEKLANRELHAKK